jgi:hypothetical protein
MGMEDDVHSIIHAIHYCVDRPKNDRPLLIKDNDHS